MSPDLSMSIDPLTPAPFPPHVRMITWGERSLFATRITFPAVSFLFLPTYFLFYYLHEFPKQLCVIPGKLLCPSHSASIFTQASQPAPVSKRYEQTASRTRRRRSSSAHFNHKKLLNVPERLWKVGDVECAPVTGYRSMEEGWRAVEDEGDRKLQLGPLNESTSVEAAGVCVENTNRWKKNTLWTLVRGFKLEICLSEMKRCCFAAGVPSL